MSESLDYLPDDPDDIGLSEIQEAIEEDPFEVPYNDKILTQAARWRDSDDSAEQKRWDRLISKISGNDFHMAKSQFVSRVEEKANEIFDDDRQPNFHEMEPHNGTET